MDRKQRAVFISSTRDDLQGKYRNAARDGAQSAGYLPVCMETFLASKDPPLQTCRDEVDKSDVVVVIVAHRYGWTPPGENKCITWLECEHALSQGKPV